MADRVSRGRKRQPPKPAFPRSNLRLTRESVAELRADYIAGMTRAGLAAKYGLSVNSIADYVSGRSWKDVPMDKPALAEARKRASKTGAKITPDTVREIRARLAAGETGRAVAIAYGLHFATISDIKLGKIWADV